MAQSRAVAGDSLPGGEHAKAVAGLRAAIRAGELFPNERLIEAELSRQYGVGRAAVRSALIELENEGLVEREPYRGARVRSITLSEAIEISEARMVLEGLIAAKAAVHVTAADAAALRAMVAEMRECVQAADLVRYSGVNARLHQRLREMARHETASRMIEKLHIQTVRLQFRIALVPGRASQSLQQHAAIVEAVCSADAERSDVVMRMHIGSVIEVLRQMPQGVY